MYIHRLTVLTLWKEQSFIAKSIGNQWIMLS